MTRRWDRFLVVVLVIAALLGPSARAEDAGETTWWNRAWPFRTTVSRGSPWQDDAPRPVEVAVDFPLLLARAGVAGVFDPESLRVVERRKGEAGREMPFAYRTEFNARAGRSQSYLAWIARPRIGEVGQYDLYFDTQDGHRQARRQEPDRLPPENLLVNAGFEDQTDALPSGWKVSPSQLVRLGRFAQTTGRRSLNVVVDEKTPSGMTRDVTIWQEIDVSKFAGQELVFECDLLAQRAAYGAPVMIELEQFRADGSRIPQCAVDPRWLTIELAQGQLVQFSERGRLDGDAVKVNVKVRMRCSVRDADSRERVEGPESLFTIWLDRVVVRPGERWSWPARTAGGFVEGALEQAPLNRGVHFTGQRRLVFNGASEGTLSSGKYNPDPRSVHWGLEAGTLEFWCRPTWDAGDERERVFFDSVAYGHRRQSRLRRLNVGGRNALEFSIADAGRTLRTVRGPADLEPGRWHHIAATWDFPKAHLKLFVDGKPIATEGPHARPWPSSPVAVGEKKSPGIGIMEEDSRSMPMQAFIGGDTSCAAERGAEAVLDEFRISDVARYEENFTPAGGEFPVDEHTRVLFHLENEQDGIHASDDRFVRGHLACELPRQEELAVLEVLEEGAIERRPAVVKPRASEGLFEMNRAENRLTVTRPFEEPPDPRFVEYRGRRIERTVTGSNDGFALEVQGDYEPLMRSVTFEHSKGSGGQTTLLPRWRANDNVVPFSAQSIAATLGADATDPAEKALEVFRYALALTNYYDAPYCETLPAKHRDRISYTLTKAVNIYPFDQCGPLNHTLRKLFLAAGISSNDASGTHHQFEQAYYGGTLRLFDLSPRKYWLGRDNATVAARRTFEDDLYLKLRQEDGIASGIRGRKSRARFGSATRPHSMDFPLHQGERVSFCWHNEGRWFEVTDDRQPIPLAKIPPYFGNGAIIYEPAPESEAAVLENIAIAKPADGPPVLRAKNPAEPASLIYRAGAPYIFSDATVAGRYTAQAEGAVILSLSLDEGKSWRQVWQSTGRAGPIEVHLLDDVTGRYAYRLKVDLAAGGQATVSGLTVRTTIVASPLALPGRLSLGENRIRFVGGPVRTPVKTDCRWTERHRSDLGVSLNAIGYYMNGDEAHRNLFIVEPGGEVPVRVSLRGRAFRGEVALEGLPQGWKCEPASRRVAIDDDDGSASDGSAVEFLLRSAPAEEGDVEAFEVVVREPDRQRRIAAQVLVARAALAREAEDADGIEGEAAVSRIAPLSGGRGVALSGDGCLTFALTAPSDGTYALWLRARWAPEASTGMTLAVDGKEVRPVRAAAMIGFTDWTDPRRAHTKMFAHFGEQYGHWSWYRIPEVDLAAGEHRLAISAGAGTSLDAVLVVPQNAAVDRATMNLLQNWNYAPWENPL